MSVTHSHQTMAQQSDEQPLCSKAEQRAVRKHQARLSKEWERSVSSEEALQDWLRNHAQAWREQRQAECLKLQEEEIRKHKWIESEKARHDVGKAAVMDWIRNHAAAWRQWYETEYDAEAAKR